MKRLEDLEIELWEPSIFIDAGNFGEFHRISNDLGVKVLCKKNGGYLRPRLAKRRLMREFKIQKALYDGQISVPSPLRIENFEAFSDTALPGLFMQYIEGRLLEDLYGREKSDVFEIAMEEVEKATSLGFVPCEDCCGSENIIKSNLGRVYLIDFGSWNFLEGYS